MNAASASEAVEAVSGPRLHVLACGALAGELEAVLRANGSTHATVEYLQVELHDTPDRIAPRVEERLEELAAEGVRVFVAYADCGTRGDLDRVLARHGAERLPGAHCYQLFAGEALFGELMEEEPGTFFLTDFLVRNFDRLVFEGLGLDRHPELRATYFGGYRRVVHLVQAPDPALAERAEDCATRLGLPLERRITGRAHLGAALERAAWRA